MRKPDFLIIGCQKSGTTALKYYISQHPDIWMPKDELHFFDQRYKKGMKWYLSHFNRPEKCVGEKTPAYIFFPTIPKHMRQMNKDLKLIVLLREPVSRAYSEYMMQHLKGSMPYSFEHLVLNAKGEVNKDRVCIRRGLYAEQLRNLYMYFDKKQVLVLKAEDLKTSKQETLDKVFKFLGVALFIPHDLTNRHIGGQPKSKTLEKLTGVFTAMQHFNHKHSEIIHWTATKCIRALKHFNKTKNGYDPMKESTRQKLEEFFKEPNRELYEMEGISW